MVFGIPTGETALKAFTRGGVISCKYCIIRVYQWWYTIGMRTNQDLYVAGFLINCFVSFITSWLVTSSTTI
jgi:photosystem I P700 chlorophyll a apoprotein A2